MFVFWDSHLPLQYWTSDPADGIFEKVRFIKLRGLAVALAERAFAQTARLGFGFGRRPGRQRWRTYAITVTVAAAANVVISRNRCRRLLLHAIYAQQKFGQSVVVRRDGRRGASAVAVERRRRKGVSTVGSLMMMIRRRRRHRRRRSV